VAEGIVIKIDSILAQNTNLCYNSNNEKNRFIELYNKLSGEISMKRKLYYKNFIKRVLVLILIIAVCCACLYYSLKKINYTISVLQNEKNIQSTKTIVIDAGHGGMDSGCSSVNGTEEKGINLNIAKSLKEMLFLFGYNVVMTRESDVSIYDKGVEGTAEQKLSDMRNRLEIFNKNDNQICISIHQNQFTDPQYSGAQVFYSSHLKENQELATIMQNTLAQMLDPENTREIKECGDSLYLCCNSENPTVMVECGFLSNPDEALKLESEEYQNKVAFTVLSAINNYLS
jgi:N-acetylmuramoyl-L-alanine amidase